MHLHYDRIFFDAVAIAADAVLMQKHTRQKHTFNTSVKIMLEVDCVCNGARSYDGIEKRGDVRKNSARV